MQYNHQKNVDARSELQVSSEHNHMSQTHNHSHLLFIINLRNYEVSNIIRMTDSARTARKNVISNKTS